MSALVSKNSFILYGTSACHLCELAENMLQLRQAAGDCFTYDKVDISESDELFERYGVLIPVLRHPLGQELGWPFSDAQLAQFLDS